MVPFLLFYRLFVVFSCCIDFVAHYQIILHPIKNLIPSQRAGVRSCVSFSWLGSCLDGGSPMISTTSSIFSYKCSTIGSFGFRFFLQQIQCRFKATMFRVLIILRFFGNISQFSSTSRNDSISSLVVPRVKSNKVRTPDESVEDFP